MTVARMRPRVLFSLRINPSHANLEAAAGALKSFATLIDEHVSPLDPVSLLPLQKLEAVDFIAFEVVRAVSAALEPAYDDRALGQVDIVPPEIASLRYQQAMAIERDQPIPMAVQAC